MNDRMGEIPAASIAWRWRVQGAADIETAFHMGGRFSLAMPAMGTQGCGDVGTAAGAQRRLRSSFPGHRPMLFLPGRGWQQIPFSPPYETNDREADVTDHDIGIRKECLPGSATCGWEWQDSRWHG